MLVTVSGDASFKRFAVACDKASGPGFERHMDRGLREAGEDLGHAVRATTDIFMPSGYEDLFRSRLMSKVEILHGARRGMRLTMYARGKVTRREVERLEQGMLRHPVFGRTRRLKSGLLMKNPWSAQKIRSGFFSTPIKYATPQAIKRLDAALGRVLDQIGRAG